MYLDQVIVPAPAGSEGYEAAEESAVALSSRRDVQGTVYRKHILTQGRLIHPQTGEHIQIDQPFFDSLRRNFENQVCDSVAVPLADAQNRHSEDPTRNLGEVVGLEQRGRNLYALMDIRDTGAAPKMGKTLLGASAFLSLNYKDTRSGSKVGPTLLHTCVTNRPYLTDLQPYEEVIAATADGISDDAIVLTPEENMPMTREELLAALRDEHGIDVGALQAQAAQQVNMGALAAQLSAALEGSGRSADGFLDDGVQLTQADITGAIAELAQMTQSLQSENAALARERAANEINGYIRQGRVLPRQREAFVELALSNREMLDQLLPDQPVVALNHSVGQSADSMADGSVAGGTTYDLDAELARLTAPNAPTARFFEQPGQGNR